MLDVLTDEEVAGALTWRPHVSSWLAGGWLGTVPVADGSVTWSTRREVPGSLELTVPRRDDGFDWCPKRDAAHPLAANGQVLRVAIQATTLVSKRVATIPVGSFRITSWQDNGDTVSVTAVSMFRLIENARLRRATSPRSGGTLVSELRRLVPSSMGLTVDAGLTDRACPAMTWGESRMDAIQEIARAWPARLRETMTGGVSVLPPLAAVPTPVNYLHDGVGGTVVSAYPSGSEDGLFNVIVARGTESDDAGAPMIQHDEAQTTGPLSVSRFGEKVMFFSSPLITSGGQAIATAQTMLADKVRQSLTLPVIAAADPRIELDDAAEVLDADGERYWGYVSGYTLPLRANGDMRIDVEVAE